MYITHIVFGELKCKMHGIYPETIRPMAILTGQTTEKKVGCRRPGGVLK
jgi:hypothetical protein